MVHELKLKMMTFTMRPLIAHSHRGYFVPFEWLMFFSESTQLMPGDNMEEQQPAFNMLIRECRMSVSFFKDVLFGYQYFSKLGISQKSKARFCELATQPCAKRNFKILNGIDELIPANSLRAATLDFYDKPS